MPRPTFKSRNRIIQTTCGLTWSAVALWPSTACATVSHLSPCNTGSCFRQYQCLLNECNDQFNNDHPDSDDYLNPFAWEQCRGAAGAHRAACRDGVSEAVLDIFWAEFINNLKSCMDEFGEDGANPNQTNLDECLEEALEDYKQLIENWLEDNTSACAGQAVPRRSGGSMLIGPMESLRSAAIQAGNAEGRFLTSANSTVTVAAGVTTGPSSYDASAIPCVKSAMAIMIYRTKAGAVVVPIDADIDPSNGTTFDVMFFGADLVDTDDALLVAVFFDQHDKPVFGEFGWFDIASSPIQGDWNRDGVTDATDLAEYMQTHSAAMSRADLNGDGSVTDEDTWVFMQGYAD